MTTRRRKATSNRKTKHRPQIGFKVDPATGLPSRTQPRFNFDDDPQEFEYRLALVRQLYHEDCKANEGSECWSPLALSYARQIERGVYEIPFEVPQDLIEDGLTADQLAIEYVFTLRVQQKNYPSLKLVPADEELFRRGIVGNRTIEAQRVSSLYSDLVNEGTIESVPTLKPPLKTDDAASRLLPDSKALGDFYVENMRRIQPTSLTKGANYVQQTKNSESANFPEEWSQTGVRSWSRTHESGFVGISPCFQKRSTI